MGSIWQPIHHLFFSLCVQPHDQPHARPRGVKKTHRAIEQLSRPRAAVPPDPAPPRVPRPCTRVLCCSNPHGPAPSSRRRTTAMAGGWSSPYAAMVEGGARPAPPWPGAEARPAVRRASLLLLSSAAAHRHFTPWLMPGHGSPAHLALLLFCGRGSLATCAWPAVEGDAHSMWVEPRPLFRCRGNPYLERICSPGLDPTP